jgi:hypothetical protein
MSAGVAPFTRSNLRAFSRLGFGRYPHLGPDDVGVWDMFMSLALVSPAQCVYDVRLGGAMVWTGVEGSAEHRLWAGLVKKRVDVVVSLESAKLVVEVKPVGSMSALGQAVCYRSLARREWKTTGDVLSAVVCSVMDVDLIDVCAEVGVLWCQVGFVGGPVTPALGTLLALLRAPRGGRAAPEMGCLAALI